MRHRKANKKFKRDIKERKALFKSLIIALIKYGKIRTTVAKAKAVQRLIDKLVTKAKDGSSSATRQLSSFLVRKDLINKLVNVIAPRFKDRKGGYSRMVRIGMRKGDAAEEAILEWTTQGDKDKEKSKKSKEKKVKSKK